MLGEKPIGQKPGKSPMRFFKTNLILTLRHIPITMLRHAVMTE